MAGLKKLVAVTLAVAVLAVVAVYALRPTANPNRGTVVINEPETPDTPNTPNTPDTPDAGDPPGGEPTSPPAPPHGRDAPNGRGPSHAVCVPANSHVPDHAADEGANRYRGTCAFFPGRGPG